MTAATALAPGFVGLIHFSLTADGEPVDSSTGRAPLPYLHGAGNLVPGLERALAGRVPGDAFEVRVAPEEGYGVGRHGGPKGLPRAAFPPELKLHTGMQFTMEGPGGELLALWVAGLDRDVVFVTREHPLAGKTLIFQVRVVDVRQATPEELAAGRPRELGLPALA